MCLLPLLMKGSCCRFSSAMTCWTASVNVQGTDVR